MEVVNYGELAIRAKAKQEAAKVAAERQIEPRIDPTTFFEAVEARIDEEMSIANVELHRRGMGTIGRNRLPSFGDKICLTYGISNLCSVELDLKGGKCRIKAIISGPPNGYEISRKEYLFNHEEKHLKTLQAEEPGLLVAGYSAHEIAVDVISCLIMGQFD
jgi:hypothetical protein